MNANDADQQPSHVWFVDATLSLTAKENEFVWSALTFAVANGLLARVAGQFHPNIVRDVYNKIVVANAEQGCANAQAFCLQQGLPFGSGTDTLQ
ncbi:MULTISPECIES: hypothetical protein [Burkholderia cepacia complex]|uniref:hypothetical protein n=1 Tax=Burkholderia cepacia complex TaxID=87882 RepID=UPI0019077EA1|nr:MULTISPECIES: hypothetical protein [Burkholderia cepacia complex]MBK1820357.1 hypothetical protein [Burkholderia orbicola]MCA7966635.1 hypothetical protein [Burkholderia cenocepacia]MDR8058904.1 hypothetical protein [Burkholderia cenocepacia]MDR8061008.1 hypothetical protein [Burkholderia cenocepacia]